MSVAVFNQLPELGYTHWADGKPTTPGKHSAYALYPSTAFDRISLFCSCGQWGAHGSTYHAEPQDIANELRAAWETHRSRP